MKRFVFLVLLLLYSYLFAQTGSFVERRTGIHSGNRIRTTFFNFGLVGRQSQAEDFGGEWPINSGHEYIGDVSLLVGAEIPIILQVIDTIIGTDTLYRDSTAIIHSVEVSDGPRGNNEYSVDGNTFWGWEPIPGYASPDTDLIAMSHLRKSWPSYWPDKMDVADDPGWPGSWNGYFGKDQANADQESYFVMDDDSDEEFQFYPDSTDSTRRGLGLQVGVRGFQWSNPLAQDCIFWHYDITNMGTSVLNKVCFGMIVGTITGGDGDTEDDCADFIKEENITYSYDYDGVGAGGWYPVGYAGYAFLESPGDPFNGLDDDGDGKDGPGPILTEEDFEPISYSVGKQVVVIDYNTFDRTVTTMPDSGVLIHFLGDTLRINPGEVLTEDPHNRIDDNLNGLIDENADIHLLFTCKYKNWLTGEGLDNLLIDESRDDGIDNDEDWDVTTDDVGADGAPGTGDTGEDDGIPTPGEPNFDATDKDESDQIGLTSFYFFHPFNMVKLKDDIKLWNCMKPGYFNVTEQNVDGDFIYGSGYFSLKPGQTERISVALLFGENAGAIVRTKQTVQMIYNWNYRFARAPDLPTLRAVPGDKKVTLYWDDRAEHTFDPRMGYDFEGYKVYRATWPTWDDAGEITDGYGIARFNVPIAKFDLKDSIMGFFPIGLDGIQFYLGNDTGLQHSFVDTTVQNGQTYFYAVTAYDTGCVADGIIPSETSKFASVDQAGQVTTALNVVAVTPEAPAAGYVAPSLQELEHINGFATGKVEVETIDPKYIRDEHKYQVTFIDSNLATQSFTLVDITDPLDLDTVVENSPNLEPWEERNVVHGFRLYLDNDSYIDMIDSLTGWVDTTILPIDNITTLVTPAYQGRKYPADYAIIFSEEILDTSIHLQVGYPYPLNLPAVPVYFTVLNINTQIPVKFALHEMGGTTDSTISPEERIIFLQVIEPDTSLNPTWVIKFSSDTLASLPGEGDTLHLYTTKPFRSNDVYEFTIEGASIDKEQAKIDLEKIKVVPNPYFAAATWEKPNPYTSGRGPREIHFIHLPSECTIRIYNLRGDLIQKIEHETDFDDGTCIWNMLTKDNLDIAYGVYFYHIEAPGIGEKTGKFAVIK
ncbi:hypothetical protein KAX02_03315 [candidate division WOR-3 bacterium]|nr:hypothetical protein [candidate division WOR-3 bacterium]